jgi:hypothetical protein
LIGYPKFSPILPIGIENEVVGPNNDIWGLYRLEKPIKRGVISKESDAKLII